MAQKEFSEAFCQYWFDFMWEKGAIQKTLEQHEKAKKEKEEKKQ